MADTPTAPSARAKRVMTRSINRVFKKSRIDKNGAQTVQVEDDEVVHHPATDPQQDNTESDWTRADVEAVVDDVEDEEGQDVHDDTGMAFDGSDVHDDVEDTEAQPDHDDTDRGLMVPTLMIMM